MKFVKFFRINLRLKLWKEYNFVRQKYVNTTQ